MDFALIKWKPEVRVFLEPDFTEIPPRGMNLHYSALVRNILIDPTPFDVWFTITTPAGNTFVHQQMQVSLQPGGQFWRSNVPLYIPAGTYTLEAHLGVAPPDTPPRRPHRQPEYGAGIVPVCQAWGVTNDF